MPQADRARGNAFTPLVVAPAMVPVIGDETAAGRAPELNWPCCCIAHGQDADAEAVARSAYATLQTVTELLSDDRQLLCHDLISTALPEAARIALEKLMASGNFDFQSDFARKYLTRGPEEGLEEGLEKGREEGEVAGQAKALLAVLESVACASPKRLARASSHAPTSSKIRQETTRRCAD